MRSAAPAPRWRAPRARLMMHGGASSTEAWAQAPPKSGRSLLNAHAGVCAAQCLVKPAPQLPPRCARGRATAPRSRRQIAASPPAPAAGAPSVRREAGVTPGSGGGSQIAREAGVMLGGGGGAHVRWAHGRAGRASANATWRHARNPKPILHRFTAKQHCRHTPHCTNNTANHNAPAGCSH